MLSMCYFKYPGWHVSPALPFAAMVGEILQPRKCTSFSIEDRDKQLYLYIIPNLWKTLLSHILITSMMLIIGADSGLWD